MNVASGRLVVVDDDEYVLERVRRSFTIDGWTLTTFQSPIDALDHLRFVVPDVLVIDQRMPPIFGLEVLAELAADVDLASFRIYLTSVVPLTREEADQARLLGATELDKELLRSTTLLDALGFASQPTTS